MHSIFEMKFNPSSLNSQYAKSMCGPLKFLFSNYNFKYGMVWYGMAMAIAMAMAMAMTMDLNWTWTGPGPELDNF